VHHLPAIAVRAPKVPMKTLAHRAAGAEAMKSVLSPSSEEDEEACVGGVGEWNLRYRPVLLPPTLDELRIGPECGSSRRGSVIYFTQLREPALLRRAGLRCRIVQLLARGDV
jgi:hypothetical protein